MKKSRFKTKTYVISLKGSDVRRASINQELSKFGIQYEIVDAVRGADLDIENDDRINHKLAKELAFWLTPGTIGCALSHLECYKKAIAEDLDYVVIFEDDAKITSDYTSYLDKVFENLQDREVCLLYQISWAPLILDSSSKVALDQKAGMFRFIQGHPIAATAYILTRQGYRSLAQNILPISTAADVWNTFLEKNFISGIACIYPYPVDTMDFKSDIDYVSSSWKKKVSVFIDKKKIFPLYNILKIIRRRNREKMKMVTIK
jgi:glycosyl transferase family 25